MKDKKPIFFAGGGVKCLIGPMLFIISIVVFPHTVKALASDPPSVSSGAPKAGQKSPAEDNEFNQIVDLMMQNGLDSRYGDNLAPNIGLPGARPVKGRNIRSKKVDANRGSLNCAVAYERMENGDRRPLYIFLQVAKQSGQDAEVRYYRLNLDGQLEKVTLIRSKRDKDGKGVRGSGTATDENLTSPEVKKNFAAEMADVRQWLRRQTEPAHEEAPPGAAKAGNTDSKTAKPAKAAP